MTKSGVLPAKKDFLVPTKAEWLGKLRGENLPPVKLAEDSACRVRRAHRVKNNTVADPWCARRTLRLLPMSLD